MRMTILWTAVAATVIAADVSAQQPSPPRRPAATATAPVQRVGLDQVVGVVGTKPITWYDLQERINIMRQEGRQIPADSAAYVEFARSVLNQMIDEEVLVQKAAELKVEVPDADLTNSVERQFKQVRERFASESEFRTQLQRAGLGSPEEYRRFLTEQLRRDEIQRRVIDKLRQEGKLVQVTVTDAEVSEAFERNKGRLPRKEPTVTFRQIVMGTQPSAAAKAAARAKAESLLAEVKRGGDFESIAKRESMDPSKDVGGDLGWARRGQMVPAFEWWLFSLPPGGTSPVVETPFGFHIIRVERVQPGEVKSRHILIRPTIDSTDIARARLLADSIAAAWRRGASFDSLAKLYHDYASKEETSLLTPFPRPQLPESYQQALRDVKVNDISVFSIAGPTGAPKFVVLQLLSAAEGGEFTLSDMRERIRDQLRQENSIRRLLDSLRRQTYVSVRLDNLPAAPAAG
ncbi:MAG: peptidylprolyl isomerase [Gemmatimonadaceae bacterium]